MTIQLFLWEYRQSLALILLGTLAIGVIVGLLVSVPAVIRRNLKTARVQKQADSLTETIQEKEQAIATATQTTYTTQQNYEELLRSLGVLDPITGLIRQDLIHQTVSTQLAHFQKREDVAQLPALSVLMFKVLPVLEDGYPLDAMFASVADLLRQRASLKTWFYSDGRGIFTATLAGLDTKAMTHYSEELQAAILEHPPVLPTGKAMELDVSVGGAIAETPTVIDAHQLVQTAEKALEEALQRGRNRVRILQAS